MDFTPGRIRILNLIITVLDPVAVSNVVGTYSQADGSAEMAEVSNVAGTYSQVGGSVEMAEVSNMAGTYSRFKASLGKDDNTYLKISITTKQI